MVTIKNRKINNIIRILLIIFLITFSLLLITSLFTTGEYISKSINNDYGKKFEDKIIGYIENNYSNDPLSRINIDIGKALNLNADELFIFSPYVTEEDIFKATGIKYHYFSLPIPYGEITIDSEYFLILTKNNKIIYETKYIMKHINIEMQKYEYYYFPNDSTKSYFKPKSLLFSVIVNTFNDDGVSQRYYNLVPQ